MEILEILEMMKEYIKPEFMVLVFVLLAIGFFAKKSKRMKNEDIPIMLAIIGVLLCVFYVFATTAITGYQSILLMLFTATVQGILVAGGAVFIDQVKKQNEYKKSAEEETEKRQGCE